MPASVVSSSPSLFGDLLFADHFDHGKATQWFQENISVLFQSLTVYLLFIFVVRHYLQERKGFELRTPLAIWNLGLAVFSAIGFLRMAPTFLHAYQKNGLVATYSRFTEIQTGACGYWMFLWRMSKIPEFVDSFFLVLRKKNVTFMHLFHHVSTSLCVFVVHESFSEYNGLINYFIHAIMQAIRSFYKLFIRTFRYTYFALCSIGYRPSPRFAHFITTIQLIQVGQSEDRMGVISCFQFIVSEFIYAHTGYLALVPGSGVSVSWGPYFLTVFTITSQLCFWVGFMNVEYFKNGGRKYSRVVKKFD
ncbi:Elongation of very long chain fatty acids protein [Aphelenchoides fujianensis]|nr:Elongation of very long chain fatty acids protein [Aphelenchoides fujianensis]